MGGPGVALLWGMLADEMKRSLLLGWKVACEVVALRGSWMWAKDVSAFRLEAGRRHGGDEFGGGIERAMPPRRADSLMLTTTHIPLLLSSATPQNTRCERPVCMEHEFRCINAVTVALELRNLLPVVSERQEISRGGLDAR